MNGDQLCHTSHSSYRSYSSAAHLTTFYKMRTFGASLMFYLICECYSSTAAAQHSSKATGCSSCFNAGRNSNRHEKLSLTRCNAPAKELLHPTLTLLYHLLQLPLWLLCYTTAAVLTGCPQTKSTATLPLRSCCISDQFWC